jgi:hypothetical protein
MLRNAFAVTSLMVGLALATAPAVSADPPYRNCRRPTPTVATTSRPMTRPTALSSTATATDSHASPTRAELQFPTSSLVQR